MQQWDVMWEKLVEYDLQSVAPEDAAEMQASGDWVLVDVRPSKDFDKASVEGATSAPLFNSMSMQSVNLKGLLRGAAYALNGVAPVEPNLTFSEDLKKASGGKSVILMCETGGTIKPTTNFMTGKTSRSLKAAFRAVDEKLAPKVAHLDGGIFAWANAGRPIRGEYDGSNAGKTPGRAEEPTVADPEPKDVPMVKRWFARK